MEKRIVLFADEGKVLTDGKTYGTQIFLGENDVADNYREITVEEYKAIEAENNNLIE